jgi:RimJ/RimL family protein N-acetyltransferase
MDDNINLRLRPVNIESDIHLAVHWYQDPEVLYFSEGPNIEAYSVEKIRSMYQYLSSIGTLYIIEILEKGEWKPIGDVTLSKETIPIIIGDRNYRSKGIGTRVIEQIIDKAREAQWTELKVKQVFHFNERSHRMLLTIT